MWRKPSCMVPFSVILLAPFWDTQAAEISKFRTKNRFFVLRRTVWREEVPVVDGEAEDVLFHVPDKELHARVPVRVRSCHMNLRLENSVNGSMTILWCGSGSMPLNIGSGSCYFRHWPSRRQQQTNFKKGFPAYYLLKVHLHHFFEDKKSKRSHKTVGIKVFLTIFA